VDILIGLALAPALVLLYYVYKKDTVEHEPIGLVLRMFVLGAVGIIPAILLEMAAGGAIEANIPAGFQQVVISNFLGVALIEEAVKFFVLSRVAKRPEFNYVFDGIVYGVAVALGFAALENVLYVMEGGVGTAVSRAIFAVPGHCADGVIMGCFFGLAHKYKNLGQRSNYLSFMFLALFVPVIEHGLYDSALSFGSDAFATAALVFDIVFIIIAMVVVKKTAKRDEPLDSEPPESHTIDLPE
jgi:RsiW-degrading membrane proteinase PrsW (M82 family)